MQQKPQPKNWHNVAKTGILAGKLLFTFFLLCIVITATSQLLSPPYSIFVIGIEVSLALLATFTIIRMSSIKKFTSYDFERLKQQTEPVRLLLTNINSDIIKYEQGASYYFNGVRLYKYSTLILAGLSTIILGLDLSNYETIFFGKMNYTTFAKNAALIIGAVITVSTSLMSYWNIEKYWLTNKTIVNKLKALRDDIENDFVAGKLNNNETKIEEKIHDYKKVKDDFYKYWEGALADRGSQSGQNSSIN